MVLFLIVQNQGNDITVKAELFSAIVVIYSIFSVNVSFKNNYLKITFILLIYLVISCILVLAYRLTTNCSVLSQVLSALNSCKTSLVLILTSSNMRHLFERKQKLELWWLSSPIEAKRLFIFLTLLNSQLWFSSIDGFFVQWFCHDSFLQHDA